jgi:hypothetical protein
VMLIHNTSSFVRQSYASYWKEYELLLVHCTRYGDVLLTFPQPLRLR